MADNFDLIDGLWYLGLGTFTCLMLFFGIKLAIRNRPKFRVKKRNNSQGRLRDPYEYHYIALLYWLAVILLALFLFVDLRYLQWPLTILDYILQKRNKLLYR